MNFTRVTSPIAGRVSRAEVTRGNLVTGGNNGGTLLTSVVSMDPIYLYFDGDEQAYLRYTKMARSGERPSSRDTANPVQVGLANEEGFPHPGTVDFVDNQLNPQTGTIRARAVLQNKDGQFTPGMFARVQLLGSGEYTAILIEDRAVNTDQNQKYVLLLGANNQIEYRKVKLGRVIDGLRVVREGLKPGDVIVVNGAQRVHPGITVTPQRVTMGAAERERRGRGASLRRIAMNISSFFIERPIFATVLAILITVGGTAGDAGICRSASTRRSCRRPSWSAVNIPAPRPRPSLRP